MCKDTRAGQEVNVGPPVNIQYKKCVHVDDSITEQLLFNVTDNDMKAQQWRSIGKASFGHGRITQKSDVEVHLEVPVH